MLKKEYPDLISTTINYYPENYEVIDFEKFLNREFPDHNLFIPELEWGTIITSFNNKYGKMNWKQEESFFKEHGVLKAVPFTELKYYQAKVGIKGPQHTKIDEPVFIFKHNNQFILYNGYHRALMFIVNDEIEIVGHVFECST